MDFGGRPHPFRPVSKALTTPSSPLVISSSFPYTEALFPSPLQYAAPYPPYSATNQQFLDGHESIFPPSPPFPAPYETPPPARSFYPSCLPSKLDSGQRLFTFNNCHIISPRASSISLPVPPHPNPQSKSFSNPSSPKHNKIKLKPYPGNSQTHQVSLSRFPNRFVFPKLLVTNAESLNLKSLLNSKWFQNQI